MDLTETRVKLIHSEAERLGRFFDSLAKDDWNRNSACDLWQIGDVIAHLVWVAEFYLDTVSRGIRGDATAPEGRPPAEALKAPSFDEYLAQAAITRREALGELLLRTFHARYDELNQMMADIKPHDWEKPCAFWRSRTIPAESFTYLAVQELAIHGWDIRSKIEPASSVSAECVPDLLERIPLRPVPWLSEFVTSSLEATTIRYRFELIGVSPGRYDIVVENKRAQMMSAEDTPADVICSCEGGIFVLLMYGRLTLDVELANDRLTIEGDSSLISDIDRWLKGAKRPA